MIYDAIIGIDPGVTTGFAVIENNALTLCQSFLIHDAMELVKDFKDKGTLLVVFEDARQRKWVPWQKNEKAERGRAQGAGSIKRDCEIWESFLISHGINYRSVAPKDNKTKLFAENFNRITGWVGRTNNHARDAAMLIVGMRTKKFEQIEEL